MKTRIAKKIATHQQTDGLARNAGIRPTEDDDGIRRLAESQLLQKVILDGVVHPFQFYKETHISPGDITLYQTPIPRDGQVNEMAVFCEQIIDGPAYLRAYDRSGTVKDKENDEPIEVLLKSNEWAVVPIFLVSKGQMIKFNVDNVRTFPGNMRSEDIAIETGSPNLSLSGVWIAGMYFAKGGNLGPGQQPSRPTSSGSSGTLPELP